MRRWYCGLSISPHASDQSCRGVALQDTPLKDPRSVRQRMVRVNLAVLDGALRRAVDKVGDELFTIVHNPVGPVMPLR